jgi:hypothetical protein
MSETDSNEYESDEGSVEEEVAEVPSPKRRKSAKAKKDPNKPKRNMSAFFLYSQAERANTKAANPEAPFGDIVSQAGGGIVPLQSHFRPFSAV